MKQNKRHQHIITLIQEQGYASTEILVEQLNVTPQTIRRDLNDLAKNKKIQRHHGGATLFNSSAINIDYDARKRTSSFEKENIAKHVAKHIPDGATLFIDIGTTPEAVAHALIHHQNLRIVTNNLNVAHSLYKYEQFTVILAGGEIRSSDGGIIGHTTSEHIAQFRLDFGILGISAIDHDGSLLEYDDHEANIKKTIIQNSRNVFLVADKTKYSRTAMVNLGSIKLIDALFTDSAPPESIQKIMQKNEVKLHICT